MVSPIQDAERRGERLLFEVNSTRLKNSSEWKSFSDLSMNGWYNTGNPNKDFWNLEEFKFPEFFTAIDQKEKDIRGIDWEHAANGVARFCAL